MRIQAKELKSAGLLSPHQLPSSVGKDPILVCDIEYLIQAIPTGWKLRLPVLLWLSFGICTGLRAVSLCGIEWTDLVSFGKRPDCDPVLGPKYRLQIRVATSKGSLGLRTKNMVFNLGWYLRDRGPNPIYWLLCYMQELLADYSESLQALADRLSCGPQAESNWRHLIYRLALRQLQISNETTIFPAKDVMSQRLATASFLSGYPKRLFTSHGLRSGFLSMLIIKWGIVCASSSLPPPPLLLLLLLLLAFFFVQCPLHYDPYSLSYTHTTTYIAHRATGLKSNVLPAWCVVGA